MLQDARKWLAEAKLNDENGSVGVSVGMTVDAWFEFWIVNIKVFNAYAQTYLCNKVYRSGDASEDASADPRTFKYQYYDEPVCACNR